MIPGCVDMLPDPSMHVTASTTGGIDRASSALGFMDRIGWHLVNTENKE
jgi:hypothetical protein